MHFNKKTGAVLFFCTALLAACSNNNVRNSDVENDTNVVDTRRNTDTTSNYLTKDSGSINLTPSSGGTGLNQ